jgi:NAD(P)-dependent dehydrogenase (short-subunit alcohol dehydrogenase family)
LPRRHNFHCATLFAKWQKIISDVHAILSVNQGNINFSPQFAMETSLISPQKTAIVTGGNVGLGFECSRNLALQGYHVVLACRNESTAREAAQKLCSLTGFSSITVEKLDLASLQSVRLFAKRIAHLLETAQIPPVRALVNNAGLQMGEYTEYTTEGHEMTFGVNHLGHFLLTYLLAPHLTTPARVIFVASDVHDPANRLAMPFPKPFYTTAERIARGETEFTSGTKMGQQRYATSKLCNVLAAYSFADYFAQNGSEISVTAFNPGMMPGTGLARKFDAVSRFVWKNILPALRLFNKDVQTVEISGKALADLAAKSLYDGVSKKYFNGANEKQSSRDSYDTAKQRDLWETSLQLCGLHSAIAV